MGTKKVIAPPPRDYKQEMMDSVAGQEAIQPRLLALEQQYQPQYQQLQQQMMDRQMDYQLDSYGKIMPKSAQLASQYASTMAPVYGQIGQQSQDAYRQGMGGQAMGLYDSMMGSAQTGLEAGTGLTPEQKKYSEQSARSALAARGLNGNQGIMQEVLNNYQLGIQSQDRNRQFAGAMYSTGQGNFQNAMATFGNNTMQQVQAYSPANLYQTAGAMTNGLGAKIFQPESQYNASLISANQQNQMSAQQANAQNSAGIVGGVLKMAGTIGGAMIGMPMLGAMAGSAVGGMVQGNSGMGYQPSFTAGSSGLQTVNNGSIGNFASSYNYNPNGYKIGG